MKVVNLKAGSLSPTQLNQKFDSIFMQPCFYAEIAKDEKRKNWMWKIGVKRENGKNEEIEFKMCKFGNVNDENIWKKITGLDFAITLIELYRSSGEMGVKRFIKDNNPQENSITI